MKYETCLVNKCILYTEICGTYLIYYGYYDTYLIYYGFLILISVRGYVRLRDVCFNYSMTNELHSKKTIAECQFI